MTAFIKTELELDQEHTLKQAVEQWTNQGRSKEQISGVENFMTGWGYLVIKNLLNKTFQVGYDAGLKETKHV